MPRLTDAQIRRHVWSILLGYDWRFRRTPQGFVIHRSFRSLKRIHARQAKTVYGTLGCRRAG